MRIYLVAFTLGASFIAWRFSNHDAAHTHLQLRSAQHRQTHISTRFCGTIQFFWGHGIAWLAKEFNFLFVVVFGV